MKSKILFFGATFLLFLLYKGWAADILGNWIANIPDSQGTVENFFGSKLAETVFSFKVDETKLTGTISDWKGKRTISEGEINGDEISFAVVPGAGESGMAWDYTGKVSLNEIQFSRKPKDGTGQPQEFIAKREFLRHNDYIQRPVKAPIQSPPSQ
jgi:hypothetical protein